MLTEAGCSADIATGATETENARGAWTAIAAAIAPSTGGRTIVVGTGATPEMPATPATDGGPASGALTDRPREGANAAGRATGLAADVTVRMVPVRIPARLEARIDGSRTLTARATRCVGMRQVLDPLCYCPRVG
jgi:hypothetical protein